MPDLKRGDAVILAVDLRSAISLIRGVSLPLDMNAWRDDLLARLHMALLAAADRDDPATAAALRAADAAESSVSAPKGAG